MTRRPLRPSSALLTTAVLFSASTEINSNIGAEINSTSNTSNHGAHAHRLSRMEARKQTRVTREDRAQAKEDKKNAILQKKQEKGDQKQQRIDMRNQKKEDGKNRIAVQRRQSRGARVDNTSLSRKEVQKNQSNQRNQAAQKNFPGQIKKKAEEALKKSTEEEEIDWEVALVKELEEGMGELALFPKDRRIRLPELDRKDPIDALEIKRLAPLRKFMKKFSRKKLTGKLFQRWNAPAEGQELPVSYHTTPIVKVESIRKDGKGKVLGGKMNEIKKGKEENEMLDNLMRDHDSQRHGKSNPLIQKGHVINNNQDQTKNQTNNQEINPKAKKEEVLEIEDDPNDEADGIDLDLIQRQKHNAPWHEYKMKESANQIAEDLLIQLREFYRQQRLKEFLQGQKKGRKGPKGTEKGEKIQKQEEKGKDNKGEVPPGDGQLDKLKSSSPKNLMEVDGEERMISNNSNQEEKKESDSQATEKQDENVSDEATSEENTWSDPDVNEDSSEKAENNSPQKSEDENMNEDEMKEDENLLLQNGYQDKSKNGKGGVDKGHNVAEGSLMTVPSNPKDSEIEGNNENTDPNNSTPNFDLLIKPLDITREDIIMRGIIPRYGFMFRTEEIQTAKEEHLRQREERRKHQETFLWNQQDALSKVWQSGGSAASTIAEYIGWGAKGG